MSQGPRAGWWRLLSAVEDESLGGDRVATDSGGRDSDSAVAFGGLMIFTFILLTAPQRSFPALAPFRIALLTATVAIAAHLVHQFRRRQPAMTLTREIWVTAGLVGWAIVTVPLSEWPGGSVSFLLGTYLKALAIFWLLSNAVNSLTRLRRITWGLSLAGVPVAATAVDHFLSNAFLPGERVNRIVGYNAPLTENPNDLALMLNLILPLAVALVMLTRHRLARALLLVIIVLDVTGVIVTFSRAGFLTMAATFVMYLSKLRRRTERGWALAILVLAPGCVPLLPSGYSDRLSTIVDIQSDRTGSAQARWSDTVAAARFVMKHPIVGAGVGMDTLALNEERGATWTAVHNAYLEYAVDLGIPGLAMFLLLLVWCVRNTTFVQRRSAAVPALREFFYLAEGIQISLIASAVAALFHPAGYQFYFYYIAGLAVALKAVYNEAAVDQHPSSSREGVRGRAEEARR